MPQLALTERSLTSLKDGVYEDTVERGLTFRVVGGRGSFVVNYQSRQGFRRTLLVGRYPAMDLSDARRRTADLLAEVATGKDPYYSRNEAMTVSALISRYYGDRVNSSPDRTCLTFLEKEIGMIPVEALRITHIERLRMNPEYDQSQIVRALNKLAKALAYAERQHWIPPGHLLSDNSLLPSNLTTTELVEAYLVKKVDKKSDDSGILYYRTLLNEVISPFLGKYAAKSVTPYLIEELQDNWQDDPRYVTRALELLSKAYTYAEDCGLIQKGENPCKGRKRPHHAWHKLSKERVEQALTDIELCASIPQVAKDALWLFLAAGVPPLEILLLRKNMVRVDDTGGVVLLGFDKERKAYSLTPMLAKMLLQREKEGSPGSWVFPDPANPKKPLKGLTEYWDHVSSPYCPLHRFQAIYRGHYPDGCLTVLSP